MKNENDVSIAKIVEKKNNFKALEHTPLPNAKQQYNSMGCELCNFHILCYDTHHAELVCPRCGLVVEHNEVKVEKTHFKDHYPGIIYNGEGFTHDDRAFMRSRGIHTNTFKSAKERRYVQYQRILELYASHLHMSNVDVKDVKYLLFHVGNLRLLNTHVSYEVILLGMCRYILVARDKNNYLCDFSNDIYVDVGLTLKNYTVIERNIRRVIN